MSNPSAERKGQSTMTAVITVNPADEMGVACDGPAPPQILPPEREKNIKRRDGFEYFLAGIEFKKGVRFGLGIKHYRNMVVVSKIEDGSMCSEALSVFDHICDVNGDPVTDKDVTKTLLVKSLQKTQKVSLLVARPATQEAGLMMEQALNAAEEKPPSLTVAPDVRDIMRRFIASNGASRKPKSIMTSNLKPKGNISFLSEDGNDHKSLCIMTDISCMEKLQKVKKPEPPAPVGPGQGSTSPTGGQQGGAAAALLGVPGQQSAPIQPMAADPNPVIANSVMAPIMAPTPEKPKPVTVSPVHAAPLYEMYVAKPAERNPLAGTPVTPEQLKAKQRSAENLEKPKSGSSTPATPLFELSVVKSAERNPLAGTPVTPEQLKAKQKSAENIEKMKPLPVTPAKKSEEKKPTLVLRKAESKTPDSASKNLKQSKKLEITPIKKK